MSVDPARRLNEQISEEAAEWFVEFRTGDVDAAARRSFDSWVRASPEHLRAYLEMTAIWNQGNAFDAGRALDAEALIRLAREADNVIDLALKAPTEGGATTEHRWPGRRLAIAAALVLAIGGSLIAWWLRDYLTPIYATGVGEQRSFRLNDGSTVELDSRSRVRIRYSRRERVVELLEGQALFAVAKNPSRPFTVKSENASIRAVGTQFDVNLEHDRTVVTVLEGSVAVTRAEDSAEREREPRTAGEVFSGKGPEGSILVAGEVLIVAPGVNSRETTQARPANVSAATAWTRGQLVLQGASLAQVAQQFNRYSARQLLVEERASPPLRLSGVFSTDPDFLLRYLRTRPDIAVVETEKEVRILHYSSQ